MKRKYVSPESFCLDQDISVILCFSTAVVEGSGQNGPGNGGNGNGSNMTRQESLFEEDDDYDF